MPESLSPEPQEPEIPEISNELTLRTRAEYLRLVREKADDAEVSAAKGEFVEALQAEAQTGTTSDSLWIGLQLTLVCIEAGLTEKAIEAAQEGYEIADQAYDEYWGNIFDRLLV